MFLYEYLAYACDSLNRPKEELLYREKQFNASQRTGNKENILMSASILADSYCDLGWVGKARELLAKVEEINKGTDYKEAKDFLTYTAAKVELFIGNYEKAINIFSKNKGFRDAYNSNLNKYHSGEAYLCAGQLKEAES